MEPTVEQGGLICFKVEMRVTRTAISPQNTRPQPLCRVGTAAAPGRSSSCAPQAPRAHTHLPLYGLHGLKYLASLVGQRKTPNGVENPAHAVFIKSRFWTYIFRFLMV